MGVAQCWKEAAGEGAGASGRLRHGDGPWTGASRTAGALRTSTEAGRAALGPGHEGVETGAAGLAALAELTVVRRSWEARLGAVRDECEALQGALLAVARELGETDTSVRSALASIDTKTPADAKAPADARAPIDVRASLAAGPGERR
ncbi:hypothetical protein ACIQRS_01140 [Streptomyces termitum]|uniref:Uncharacterized protein n=1 Tax=Streptomyces termitum TaxID=67368 RepID=A0A918SW78_9ACTN|nr:hypothetical protein [Streptomyces termitum]GHA74555.1 hypothetical protein GCM10010305_16710 [Streptomyces termitum]